MCGIAGAFSFDPAARSVERDRILHLNALHRNRGPDGEGLWCAQDERVFLAHRRLAIIATDKSGAQPMTDATGRWIVSFNGEIYNYRELRTILEGLGCQFRTDSDTEVLINAVATAGEAGLKRLRGMFAFALWDTVNEELWLARDPHGIKPLYVAYDQGTIWFSSQARTLANCAGVDTAVDPAAVVGFHLWGHVPEPFSWWRGIHMFPPGHVQRIRRGQVPARPSPYCRIEDLFAVKSPAPLKPGELRDVMLDTIRHHLVADVPVGIFLSAGTDSRTIAALAAEVGAELRTVTIAFDEFANTHNDEAPIAEATAKALGSDHVTVRVTERMFEDLVERFWSAMDQPTIDGLNTFLVSHAAAQRGLKVVLSGIGGDELFGGYPSFRQIPSLVRWGRRLEPLTDLARGLDRLTGALPALGLPPKLAGLLSHSDSVARAYLLRRCLHLEHEVKRLIDPDLLIEGLRRLATAEALQNTLAGAVGQTDYACVAALESCWYMRNQLLRDADWTSMAHGLELRVPFVDAEVSRKLAPAIVSERPPTKNDLAACGGMLPTPPRRHKTGFSTPVRHWIAGKTGRSGRGLRGWANEVHRYFAANWKHADGRLSDSAQKATAA